MRDVLSELVELWRTGEPIGLATVVATHRSAPRLPGAAMLVEPDGSVVGSVSGGCVEGAVYELAEEVIDSGRPMLERFGFSDDDAFAVGLTCGGIIDIFVEQISANTFPDLDQVADDIDSGRAVAVATIIEHPETSMVGRRTIIRPEGMTGSFGNPRIDHAVADDALGLLEIGSTSILTYGPEGERMDTGMRIFVASYQPKPRMIVFGAIDFASALAQAGSFMGFHVTVCDARPIFATKARFPAADEVVVSWPHKYLDREVAAGRIDVRTVICVLTHDPKFDVPVLERALRLSGSAKPAYIGAMGSRNTHDDRLQRLKDVGLTDEELDVLRSPIGLDIGGRTPEETAISIAAEIIADRSGATGDRLTDGRLPIHHHEAVTIS